MKKYLIISLIVIALFAAYTKFIFSAGQNSIKADIKDVNDKVNKELSKQLAAALEKASENESAAIKFKQELDNVEEKIKDVDINDSVMPCYDLGGDFMQLFDNAIGSPTYKRDS